MNKFASRKFILVMLVTTISSIALFIGKISGGEFSSVAVAAIMMYGAANTIRGLKNGDTR